MKEAAPGAEAKTGIGQVLENVGRRIGRAILGTLAFALGGLLALLIAVPGFADVARVAFEAPLEYKTLSVAVAVALLAGGLWGIVSSRQDLERVFTEHSLQIRLEAQDRVIEKVGFSVKKD